MPWLRVKGRPARQPGAATALRAERLGRTVGAVAVASLVLVLGVGWRPPNLVVLGLVLRRQGAVIAAAVCVGIGGAGRATGTRGGRVAVVVAAALLLFEAARGLLH